MLTKLKICYLILFKTNHERVGQFIFNRISHNDDLFYINNKKLLKYLMQK